jgi:hypothetical protein
MIAAAIKVLAVPGFTLRRRKEEGGRRKEQV